MPKPLSIIIILRISAISLKAYTSMETVTVSTKVVAQVSNKIKNSDSLKKVFRKNIAFFSKQLLKGHAAVIKNYLRKYQRDTCDIVTYKDSSLKADFEGVRVIKSIYINQKPDTVFVVPPFNYCDDGESYCFYNSKLPRLFADSYCCHPSNLFVLPDIDEDGVREIGIYYSSCASRFKALNIYSLKKGRWKEIASSAFDTFMRDPEKTRFSTLIRKVSKGKFKICNLLNGKTEWKTVVMR